MSDLKKKSKKKIFITILVVILVLILLLISAAWLVMKSYLGKIDYEHDDSAKEQTVSLLTDEEIERQLKEEEPDSTESDSPEEEIAALDEKIASQQNRQGEDNQLLSSENVLNVLVIGCDSRKQGGSGRSDTMILVSVNEDTGKIHMTSIMRDCYVSIPGKGNNRINAAYAYGGGSLLLDTIESNLAVDVDKYVAIDFYSFVDIIDSMGGVDIEVSEEEIPILNAYVKELNRLNGRDESTWLLSEGGMQHLNGTQALGYARIRYVGNGDFERTERQRLVVSKVFEKAKDMNLLEINNMLNALLPEVKTNMTEEEIMSLLLKAPTYLTYDLDSMRIPVDGSYQSMRVRGMSVLGIDLDKNIDALKRFVYGEE